jgi:hypothetical protein
MDLTALGHPNLRDSSSTSVFKATDITDLGGQKVFVIFLETVHLQIKISHCFVRVLTSTSAFDLDFNFRRIRLNSTLAFAFGVDFRLSLVTFIFTFLSA